jgi:hypothetical protein
MKINSNQNRGHHRPTGRAFQADRGRLSYIQPRTCVPPQRVNGNTELPSTISLKQASTIAEMRSVVLNYA